MEELCEGSQESSMESVLGSKASTARAPTAMAGVGGVTKIVSHMLLREATRSPNLKTLTPVTTKKETPTWFP